MSTNGSPVDDLVLVDEVTCEQFDAELKDKDDSRSASKRSSSERTSRKSNKSDDRSRSRSSKRKSSKKRSKRSRSRSQSSEDSESRSRSRSRSRHGRRRSHSPNRRSRHSHGRSPRRLYRKTDSYGKGDREPPQEKRILGVFGLSISTTERQLRDVFETYERLEAVRMVYDAQTGKSRGFAFLYFDKIEAAKEAKEKLDGTRLDGNLIRVDYSVTDKPHEPTPGIYMGKTNRRTFLRRSPRGFGFRGNGYDRYPHSFRESFGSQYYDRRRWSRSRSPRI